MKYSTHIEVIIIGGSYAGLSAALALGRSLRRVLIIDAGQPCSRQVPRTHNFLTRDGETPREIAAIAREQVSRYPTISFLEQSVTEVQKTINGFEVSTDSGDIFPALKLILATGIRDLLPDIEGFSRCWGISIIHCPYCHGYEYHGQQTGLLITGEPTMHLAAMIHNLTPSLTILTNGVNPDLTEYQLQQLEQRKIQIHTSVIREFVHQEGKLQSILLEDGSSLPMEVMYAKVPFIQQNTIAEELGCTHTEYGHIKTNSFQKTNVPGVFACGDNTSITRSVAAAIASGNVAGAMVNKELIEAAFTTEEVNL